MCSESTKIEGGETGQELVASLDYYFKRNGAFGWLVASGRYPLLRFGCVLAVWLTVLWLVCRYDHALRISGEFGRPPVGLYEDAFVYPAVLSLLLVAMAVRRLLRRVDDLLRIFPDMLKPEARRDDSPLVARLAEARETIAVRSLRGRMWHGRVLGVLLALVLFFQVILPLAGFQTVAWTVMPRDYPSTFVVASLWSLFYWYLVIGNASWYVAATWFTVFPLVNEYAGTDQLRVVPIASDGQGGLAPIGAVAFGMASVLGPGILMLAAWILVNGVDVAAVILGGLYMLFFSGAFFLPLWSTHEAMRRAKHVESERIAGVFQREYSELNREGESGRAQQSCDMGEDHGVLCARVNMLANLEALAAAVKSMPVWPFDVTTFRRYVFLITTPVFTALMRVVWPHASALVEGVLRGAAK